MIDMRERPVRHNDGDDLAKGARVTDAAIRRQAILIRLVLTSILLAVLAAGLAVVSSAKSDSRTDKLERVAQVQANKLMTLEQINEKRQQLEAELRVSAGQPDRVAAIVAQLDALSKRQETIAIPGPAGAQGAQGIPGVPGINGLNGTDGKDGKDGKDGDPGRPPTETETNAAVFKYCEARNGCQPSTTTSTTTTTTPTTTTTTAPTTTTTSTTTTTAPLVPPLLP